MLDKSVPYYEFWMLRACNLPAVSADIPQGYRLVFYQPGDEKDWATIETAVLEFDHERTAREYFASAFAPYPEALSQRMLFVENEAGEKVATCTAWWKEVANCRVPLLHWLAVKPEHQGRGLAKALAAAVTNLLQETDPATTIFLHTQTWSHQAVKLYQKLGYTISPNNLDGTLNKAYTQALMILNNH